MGYCVFMLKPDSIYDDDPSVRYQFPKQYLNRAKHALKSWVVFLEPSKVPRSRGYFGIAFVEAIIPDPSASDMYLAVIQQGSYLDFSAPVPFRESDLPIERGLLNEQGKVSGRAQAAVRPITPDDFLRIIEKGLEDPDQLLPRDEPKHALPEFADTTSQEAFQFEDKRERVSQLTNRLARDKTFRKLILDAYDERCAVTGLKFINGGGRAEVNAAHIKPVEQMGPDSIQNGIALSGTAHWMFDRGLISLSDDLNILISRQVNDVESIRAFIRKDGKAAAPTRSRDRPTHIFFDGIGKTVSNSNPHP
jgi:putative restriction endonuclease